MQRFYVAFLAGLWLWGMSQDAAVAAPHWDECASALEEMRNEIDHAIEAALTAESTQRDLSRCEQFSDVHDLMNDGCRNKQGAYRSAAVEARASAGRVMEYGETVEGACYAQRSPVEHRSDEKLKRVCQLYQSVQALSPGWKALEYCLKEFDVDFCRRCLDSK